MLRQHRPITQLSLLVQYAFSIPGTSAEVERLFSIINDIWTPEKGQLLKETLEAHLNIHMNSKLNCSEYYKSIKNNKNLLGKVQNAEKYDPKPNTNAATSPTPQVDDTDDSDYSDVL